jgi:galactose mutarotase-like enzyme
VQAFPKQSDYSQFNSPFFGETIGRVANRVANAQISSLNNKSYTLAANNGPNSLHGGVKGWGKRIWDGPKPIGIREVEVEGEVVKGESVEFRLRSEDGDEGYPGTVEASVVYTAVETRDREGKGVRVLGIEFRVELVGDEVEETVVNVTNHSFVPLSPLEKPSANYWGIGISTSQAILRLRERKSRFLRAVIYLLMVAVFQLGIRNSIQALRQTRHSPSAQKNRISMIASS